MSDFDSAMRQLVAQMSVISEVAARALAPRAGVSAERDHSPSGVNRTLGDVWWAYFQAAPTPKERESVYHKARAALASARRRRPDTGTGSDRDRNIIELYEGEAAEFVAVSEGCSVSSVWRVRRTAGRKQSDGTVIF